MIAGVATVTIVVSTRIMKKPRHSANSAGQGRTSSGTLGRSGRPESGDGVDHESSQHPCPRRFPRCPGDLVWPHDAPEHPWDLMAGPPPTHLPEDPADAELAGGAGPDDVVRRHPASPVAWAAARPAGPGRRSRRPDRLRLRPGRLPPQPRPAAPQRLEGPRPGAVGARAATAASCAAWPCSPWPPARSARPRSGSAARSSCATPAPRPPTSCSTGPARRRSPASSDRTRSAPSARISVGSRGPRSASTSSL